MRLTEKLKKEGGRIYKGNVYRVMKDSDNYYYIERCNKFLLFFHYWTYVSNTYNMLQDKSINYYKKSVEQGKSQIVMPLTENEEICKDIINNSKTMTSEISNKKVFTYSRNFPISYILGSRKYILTHSGDLIDATSKTGKLLKTYIVFC